MSDKDLKQFFKDLKKQDAHDVPDFNEIFGKAQQKAKPSKKKKSIISIRTFSIAASILLVVSIGLWQFNNSSNTNTEIADEFAVRWMEEETIMDWESNTNELLPTEYSMNQKEETTEENISLPEVTKEEIKEIIAETELDSSLYVHGAISDWESPTASLMPSTMGMGLSF